MFCVIHVHLTISIFLALYVFLASEAYMMWLFIIIVYILLLTVGFLAFGWCLFNRKLRSQRMGAGQVMELGDRPTGAA